MNTAMPLAEFRFRHAKRVHFAKVDAQAVLHNTRYPEYFEIGIQEYMRAVGRYDRVKPATDIDFHIVPAELTYRHPIRVDDELDIWISMAGIGTTSLTYTMQIHTRDVDSLRATGVQVHVRAAGGRPVPVDAGHADRLEAFEGRPLRRA